MWQIVRSSLILFLQGRLVQQPGKVFFQVLLGVIVTAASLITLVKYGQSIPVAAAFAGLAGGILQPFLFRNLKYL